MRSSFVVSVLGHFLVLVALFWVKMPVAMVVPGPESVQVQLVELGLPQTVPQAAPPPPKPSHVPDIKPIPDASGVKLAPEAKAKPKEKAPPKPAASPAASLPATPVGSAGLRGEVTVDAANFEFTYYLLVLRNRIASTWSPPAGLTAGGPIRAVVFFRITRSGELSEVRLERSSGVAFFDQSAVRAVTIANPMPPLPLGYGAADLGVHFGFEYGG